jgi:hypothetical protein
MSDLHRQVVQLAGVAARLVDDPIEVNSVRGVYFLKRGPRPIWDRNVSTEMPCLDLNPARRAVMYGGDVKHEP